MSSTAAPTAVSADAQILSLFDRPVTRAIEEVVKVDQTNPAVVRQEIEEYVPTASIRAAYRKVLEAFRETPNRPHEGIGIWVSGFFGAGKSSFAKILGYALENRDVDGQGAAELFGGHTGDPEIQALLAAIRQQVPAQAVIFDVSTDSAVTDASEKLTDVVYRVLLRSLGYAQDRELAELEIELEGDGRLTAFEEAVRAARGKTWDELKRFAATARSIASAALHALDPKTFPAADSWARTPRRVELTANLVAERARELMARRGQGRALVFVVDEVGQYVARSTAKMLDLQGFVQALGREGKNHAHAWKGQAWLVVTSQERLSEVVDNLDGKTVELARLRDRFPIEVDLAPSDIREVTAQRVLKKKPSARTALAALYETHRGQLAEATRVTGKLQSVALGPETFADLYPFLPYQVDLIIDVVSGLRTQAGASRQVGGANRTIIKLAQQVLIHPRTKLGEAPVGRLVTLDMVYDLLEGLVTTERRRDVEEIEAAFGREALETRTAKALALLQFVRALPRTPENLAAVLHPRVDAAPGRELVAAALQKLRDVGKVREGEQGWELLSQVGRSWEERRRGLDVSSRERAGVLKDLTEQLFADVAGYRHQSLKTFGVLPVVGGQRLSTGSGVELHLAFANPDDLAATSDAARTRSATNEGQHGIHWVVPITEELDRAVTELVRSRAMVQAHEHRPLSGDESRLMADEKTALGGHETKAARAFERAVGQATSFFRGVQTAAAELGNDAASAARGAVAAAVPKLYEKFALGAAKLGADDARRIVEASTLAGLPAAYLDGTGGLGLVARTNGEWHIRADAPPLNEVLAFITERASFGEKATGKLLELRFTGYGYGWDFETVMLLAATLLRAGRIELYNGKRFTSYADEGAREVFRKATVFRATTFAPRSSGLDIAKQVEVLQTLEQLYGEQVALEEGAIAAAIRKRAPIAADRARGVVQVLEANGLPGRDEADTLRALFADLSDGNVEDTILAFHGQREAIRDGLTRIDRLQKATSGSNLEVLRGARRTLSDRWPQLSAAGDAPELASEAEALGEALASPDFYEYLPEIGKRAAAIQSAYDAARSQVASALGQAVQDAVDDLRNRPEWTALAEGDQTVVLGALRALEVRAASPTTPLAELRTAVQAVPGLRADAAAMLLARHETITRPVEPGKPTPEVCRVRAASFAQHALRTEADVDQVLAAIRAACLGAIARGEPIVLE